MLTAPGDIRLLILLLHGDGRHDDRMAIQHLLCGGPAYDIRRDEIILAPSLAALPVGAYRVAEFP